MASGEKFYTAALIPAGALIRRVFPSGHGSGGGSCPLWPATEDFGVDPCGCLHPLKGGWGKQKLLHSRHPHFPHNNTRQLEFLLQHTYTTSVVLSSFSFFIVDISSEDGFFII